MRATYHRAAAKALAATRDAGMRYDDGMLDRLRVLLPLAYLSGLALACSGGSSSGPPVASASEASGATSAAEDDSEVVTDEATSEAATEPEPEPASKAAPPKPAPPPAPDYHARAVKNANAVVRSLSKPILGCYKKRLDKAPNAHGNIVVNVLIAPDGTVRTIETTGGALLGDAAVRCIEDVVKQATFEKPHGGGTLRVKVPLAFRAVARDGGAPRP